MTLPYIRRVVDTANALKSDVIVLLGDYTAAYRFASDPVPYAAWAEELARLGAPLGQWAIFGNHDWWHDIASIRRALTSARIPLLENDAESRKRGKAILARRARRSACLSARPRSLSRHGRFAGDAGAGGN